VDEQVPQLPLQPSSPQALPKIEHVRMQTGPAHHDPVLSITHHGYWSGQVPQLPPHPSPPHTRFEQFGLHPTHCDSISPWAFTLW
jgi:hypothetical protein